ATQIGVIAYYLRLVFWPHPLCLDYAWPFARTALDVLRPSLVVVPLLAGTIWGFVRRPWVGFVGAWFFVTLAPTSSFIPIKDPLFEHRMYLPLAAVILAVVMGVHALLHRLFTSPSWGAVWRRSIATVCVAAIVAASIYGTARRNWDYRSDLVMWNDVIAKRPGNPRAHLGRGKALFDEGRSVEAEMAFREAVRLKPKYPDALYNLGTALSKNKKLDEAVEAYRQALQLNPRNAKAHYNLGNALKNQDKLDEALVEYREALRIKPDHITAHINLGNVLKVMGRIDEAIKEYQKALTIDPRHANAHFNLGNAYHEQGRLEEALREFEVALANNPQHPRARQSLDAAKAQLGRPDTE
ncbi:MAG: tetratricopeptide repeat protein, partial [Phycisphaerae bacterium]